MKLQPGGECGRIITAGYLADPLQLSVAVERSGIERCDHDVMKHVHQQVSQAIPHGLM